MRSHVLPCLAEIERVPSDNKKCIITFKSDVEGVATTYANLMRRALLENVSCMAVAGLRCKVNGKYIQNLFEVVPGFSGSLIDIYTGLHQASLDIESDSDDIIISCNLSGKVTLHSLFNIDSASVLIGNNVTKIDLISEDKVLTNIVGKSDIQIDVYIRRATGFSHRDVNQQALSKIVPDKAELKTWIVTDSKHQSVPLVEYNTKTVLGMQEIKLTVHSNEGSAVDAASECINNIIEQLNRFKESFNNA